MQKEDGLRLLNYDINVSLELLGADSTLGLLGSFLGLLSLGLVVLDLLPFDLLPFDLLFVIVVSFSALAS